MKINFQDHIEDGKGEIWLFRSRKEAFERSFDVFSFKNQHALQYGVDFLSMKDDFISVVANQKYMYIDKGSERLTTTFGDFENLKVGPN